MSEEDRELLRLAAGAAGIRIKSTVVDEADYLIGFRVAGSRQIWNALTEDGDALRLAIKLRINVEQSAYEIKASAYVPNRTTKMYFHSVSGNVKRDEATRRVIVLTAAAYAKATATA